MAQRLVLFNGKDSNGSQGLWRTDGTAADTVELSPNGAASGGLNPVGLTVFDGKMLFAGNGVDGAGLWITDGTAAGTQEIIGISGANSAGIFSGGIDVDFAAFNAGVLFAGVNSAGTYSLWVTDATAAGTHELTGITGGNSSGIFAAGIEADFTTFNSGVLFQGIDTAGAHGLWVTNGTAAGTHELSGISGANSSGLFTPIPGLQFLPDFTNLNGEVLFQGTDAAGNHGLWVTDGTAAGTHELTGISGANSGGIFGPNGQLPNFTFFNGLVLFSGMNAAGSPGLWVTDGTAAGTHELTGINGANSSGLRPQNFAVLKNELLFQGNDVDGNEGLWVTDGTAAGTHEITGINGAFSGGIFAADSTQFTLMNGQVLFNGRDTAGNLGLWVSDGTASGTHELAGISGANSTGLIPLDFASLPTLINDDFNGDGTSDILWRNNSSGAIETWLLSNGQMTGGTGLSTVSSAWQVVGTGDLNGDGSTDVLWRNNTSGAVESWLINKGHISGGTGVGFASSAWQVLGTGDFDHDGTTDALWRNVNTGEVDDWLITNGHITGGAGIGTVSTAWQFVGIGDFNGDGTADVLWRNTASGEVDTWLMANGHVSGGTAIAQMSTLWQPLATGDFNGDGTDDVLWQNSSTGEVDAWLMSNGRVGSTINVNTLSSAWQFAGVGDYNGDGTKDVLWRNTTSGEVNTWLMTNGHMVGGTALATVSSVWTTAG